jgi:hypothetical protein
MVRQLLVEAAQAASKFDPELRRDYKRLRYRRGNSGVAKVAIARKLAVRLNTGQVTRTSPTNCRTASHE